MRLIRSIATIGLYTIASRLFGFVRSSMQAAYLGASEMSDALVIAVKFPSMLRRMFAEGAFNAAFVPVFTSIYAKKGIGPAKSYAEEVFSLLILILTFLMIIVEIFMPQIISLVVSGFAKTPERLALTITYSRILFPFIFFISICALYSGVLNSIEKFAAAAASPMWGNIAVIIVAYGLLLRSSSPGMAFSWAFIVCAIVQAAVVIYPAYKQGLFLKFTWPKISPQMQKFFILLGPALVGSGVVQINIFIDMVIGSYLPTGSVSYLEYADRLNQLPLSVIGIAMGTALLPLLSKQIRLGNHEQATSTQNLALEYALTLAMPATIGLFSLSYPIIETVFGWGKLTPYELRQIAYTLDAFSLGLPAYILVKIFSTIFFAHHNTKTPVIVAGLAVIFNLILNLSLYKEYAHVGLAFSTALSAWFNALILMLLLFSKKYLKFNRRFKFFVPKLCLVSLVCAGSLYILQSLIWSKVDVTKLESVISLILLVILTAIIYLLACFITGIYKIADLKFMKKKA